MALGLNQEWIDLFQGGGSLEIQLALTLGLLVLGLVVLKIIVPRLVDLGISVFAWSLRLFRLDGVYKFVSPVRSLLGVGLVFVRFLQLLIVIGLSITILGVWGKMDIALTYFSDLTVPITLLIKGLITVLLLVGAYSGMGALHHSVAELTKRSDRISQHQEEIWVRVLQIIFLLAASIVALTIWGIDLGGLLVGAGFLGIVAGLAAQQTLGSLIAGFVLMLSRPFEIGDWVKIGDNEGIVTEITIVNTRLENFDGELIALPNDLVGNSMIVNRTKKGRLRLRVEVGVDYATDPEHARQIATEALGQVERVLTVPRPRVVTSRFGDSAIVLELRFWIDKPSSRRRALAISDAIQSVAEAFNEEGIKIPFPQRELSGRAETGGFRVIEDTPTEE